MPVTGNAVWPPIAAWAPDSYTEDLLVGDVVTRQLHLENNGGSDLDWSITIDGAVPGAVLNGIVRAWPDIDRPWLDMHPEPNADYHCNEPWLPHNNRWLFLITVWREPRRRDMRGVLRRPRHRHRRPRTARSELTRTVKSPRMG